MDDQSKANISVNKIIKLPRFPMVLLNLSLLIILSALLGLSLYAVNSVNVMTRIINSDFKAIERLGRILQFEEASIMAARMTVTTGDKKWQERYSHHQTILDNAIQEANTGMALETIPVNLQLVLDKLNAMKTQTMDLVRQGNINTAKQIIFGDSFDIQRKIYIDEIEQYRNALKAESQFHLQKKIKKTNYFFIAIIVSFITLITTWFFIYKYVHRLSKINKSKLKLEQLLYYEQLSAMQSQPSQLENVPIEFREIQQNFDLFSVELQRGLKNEEFVLYYQPIFSADSEKIIEVEALIRWQHPAYGLLSPVAFLPLCENSDFIIPLGAWVLATACQQAKLWHNMGHSKLCIAVNLSVRQLNDPNLVEVIARILENTQFPPPYLTLEITESYLMQDIIAKEKILKSLRNLDIQLSLDDFGTGYSSLSYLKRLPFTTLKIDRSFISDIKNNDASYTIVEAIITLGKNLGLKLIAEGVENTLQLDILKKLKCDLIQGYVYGFPMPGDKLTPLLKKINK